MRPPPPDLSDPAQFTAYRAELRGVARKTRLFGIALALMGLMLALAIRHGHDTRTMRLATILTITAGLGIAGFGVMRRTYHHRMRMMPPME